MSVHEELRFGFTFVQKQVGQHLVCNYTYSLSLSVYVHIHVAAIDALRMRFERSGQAEIRGAVGDRLPKPCFFQLNPV